MLGRAISKNSVMLGLFAVVTTAAIAGTYLGTRDTILAQERAAQARALLEIVPQSRHDNVMLDDTLVVSDQAFLGLDSEERIFIARKEGKPVAYIFPAVAPDGYSGDIRLIVGVNIDGSVAGVRILTHAETPGLGDKVELKKDDWVLSFNDTSLERPQPDQWKVKKDKGVFDQFTGATITPRAVVNAVYKTLLYYEKNGNEILKAAMANLQKANDEAANQEADTGTNEEQDNG